MPAPPLTHHEILGLVEPFARRGHHVDLAATDRIARRLVFKPLEVAGESPIAARLQQTLQLDCRDGGRFTLTRTLTCPDGLAATLQDAGAEPAALLARIEAIAPRLQFRAGPGFAIALSHEIASSVGAPDEGRAAPPSLRLTRGVAQLDGLTLSLSVMAVRGVAGDLTLTAAPGEALDLPEDLLAVQGWDWARLVQNPTGWTSKLRLRGIEPQRSAVAEAALERAARHLAQVLAEPPVRFHQRHVAARWGVVFRRSIPSLTAVTMIAAALLLPRITSPQSSGYWMAVLHYVPIAALALAFSLQELPRFEIPPLPRRSGAAAWRRAAQPVSVAAAGLSASAQTRLHDTPLDTDAAGAR